MEEELKLSRQFIQSCAMLWVDMLQNSGERNVYDVMGAWKIRNTEDGLVVLNPTSIVVRGQEESDGIEED